jgi:hypothetical protein
MGVKNGARWRTLKAQAFASDRAAALRHVRHDGRFQQFDVA